MANDAKTVAKRVAQRAGSKWFGCRVEWVKREVGDGRVTDGLGFGGIESK